VESSPTLLCIQVSDAAPPDLVGRLDGEIEKALAGLRGKRAASAGNELQITFEGASPAVRCAGEIHRLCDTLAREGEQELFARIAAHTGAAGLAPRILLATNPCETAVTAQTWAGLSADDRHGFTLHGPEVFKGQATFCILYKKLNPNPFNDLTYGPEDEECSRQFTDAMPKHSRWALLLDHPQATKTVVLSDGETHIFGRSPECGTVIADRMLSGMHVAFAVVEGILWCFDLQSSNGVSYRGRAIRRKPIEKNSMVQLPNGSIQVKLP
jgi:hypothetical protein